VTLSHTPSCVVSPKEKKKKRNINNDLAVLPSHDTDKVFYPFSLPYYLKVMIVEVDLCTLDFISSLLFFRDTT